MPDQTRDSYEIVHKNNMRWVQTLYKDALAAETSINRSLQHAKQSVENNTHGVKNDVSGAKQRLAVANASQAEYLRLKDIYWAVVALIELILNKCVTEERKAKLPPSLQEFVDEHSG